MGIRLGGYVRDQPPLAAESGSVKLLVVAGTVVFHVGVVVWWMSRPPDHPPREYVTYYDIAPLTAPIPSSIPAGMPTSPDGVAPSVPATPQP